MPSLYTHYKFGEDVLGNLPKNIQNIINNNLTLYHIFNQGNDNLYYYILHFKFYRDFGIKIHHHKVDIFFQNAFHYLKERPKEDIGIIYAYINHYVLDTLMHPLINYLVKKENIDHTKIEYLLDYYLYGNKLWKPSYYKELIPKVKFTKELRNFLQTVYFNTYEIKNIAKIFNRSHNNAYYLYRYFIYDKYGIKEKFYSLFNKNVKNNTFYIKEFNYNLLNENKNEWHHPKNDQEIYNYSFEEIYDYALKIATLLNKLAYEIIHSNKDLKEFNYYLNLVNLKNISKFPL